jgi:hypothetical protein
MQSTLAEINVYVRLACAHKVLYYFSRSIAHIQPRFGLNRQCNDVPMGQEPIRAKQRSNAVPIFSLRN